MVLKLEMFNIVGLCTCSYQGDGNQLLIAQVAGHFKIQKLCAESLDIMVSNVLFLCIHVYIFFGLCQTTQSAYLTFPYYANILVLYVDLLELVCLFSGTVAYYPNRYAGAWSTARELIDNVECTGTESKLIDCSHDINLHYSYTSPRVECQYCEHELLVYMYMCLLYKAT